MPLFSLFWAAHYKKTRNCCMTDPMEYYVGHTGKLLKEFIDVEQMESAGMKWVGWDEDHFVIWITPDGLMHRFKDLPRSELGKDYERKNPRLQCGRDGNPRIPNKYMWKEDRHGKSVRRKLFEAEFLACNDGCALCIDRSGGGVDDSGASGAATGGGTSAIAEDDTLPDGASYGTTDYSNTGYGAQNGGYGGGGVTDPADKDEILRTVTQLTPVPMSGFQMPVEIPNFTPPKPVFLKPPILDKPATTKGDVLNRRGGQSRNGNNYRWNPDGTNSIQSNVTPTERYGLPPAYNQPIKSTQKNSSQQQRIPQNQIRQITPIEPISPPFRHMPLSPVPPGMNPSTPSIDLDKLIKSIEEVAKQLNRIKHWEIYISIQVKANVPLEKIPRVPNVKLLKDAKVVTPLVGIQIAKKDNKDVDVSVITMEDAYISKKTGKVDVRAYPLKSSKSGDWEPGLRTLVDVFEKKFPVIPAGEFVIPVEVKTKVQADVSGMSLQRIQPKIGLRAVAETGKVFGVLELPISIEVSGGVKAEIEIPKIVQEYVNDIIKWLNEVE